MFSHAAGGLTLGTALTRSLLLTAGLFDVLPLDLHPQTALI